MEAVQNANVIQVRGAFQTGADWTPLFQAIPSPNHAVSSPSAKDVGATPVRLDTGLPGRQYILLVNNGLGPVYVGGSPEVTTANGIPVPAGASLTLNLGPALALWGIGTTNQDVRVLEVSSVPPPPVPPPPPPHPPSPPFNPLPWVSLWGGPCRRFTVPQKQMLDVLCESAKSMGKRCEKGQELKATLGWDDAKLARTAEQLVAKQLLTIRAGESDSVPAPVVKSACLTVDGEGCCPV